MDDVIDLLSTEPYNIDLMDYTYMPTNLWNKIPIGSHIKYIDRNMNVNVGGFLCRFIPSSQVERRVYVLKNNDRYYHFRPFFNHIFYKKDEDYTDKQKTLIKVRKYKKKNNRKFFLKLLDKL